jgi:hypothetical protein
VDDPYLKRSYGFVKFEALLGQLEESGGALTVAFIPFNYRRSEKKTIDLLRRHCDRFSIAVHGCNHTSGEYASIDRVWLLGLTGCALDRMEAHTRRTGLPYDNVMIFPQGRFSTEAIGALKLLGFEAAVNSVAWPAAGSGHSLTIKDLLQIAVTRFGNFPIFLRRYPIDEFGFAFDAFFQKPVLAVEHHGFFRTGYEPLNNFVRNTAAIKANLVWMPLGRVVASSCTLRQIGDGRYFVRYLTRHLDLQNSTRTDWHLTLSNPVVNESIEAVLINGEKAPFEIISNELRCETRLNAGQQMTLIIVQHRRPNIAWKPPLRHHLASSLRRRLSDVRDNQLARSARLLKFAESIKRLLSDK